MRKGLRRHLDVDLLSVISDETDLVFYRRRGTPGRLQSTKTITPRRLIETAFALDQGRSGRAGFNGRTMPIGFVFRCPNTGLNVQGWVAEKPSEPDSEAYEAVTCTACARVHLVDPRTGRILGSEED